MAIFYVIFRVVNDTFARCGDGESVSKNWRIVDTDLRAVGTGRYEGTVVSPDAPGSRHPEMVGLKLNGLIEIKHQHIVAVEDLHPYIVSA